MSNHRDNQNPRVNIGHNQNSAVLSGFLDMLVRSCVAQHSPEELALGWLRYEALRRVDPRTFAEIHRRNLDGDSFDDIVTESLLSWKSAEERNHRQAD